mmetsp:Transcript_32385/g.58858  ORF Transcript_32385/g.58858 Transcript_32385/m.58858 type:complete len:263 (-) Transcript_32385:434-1222(-)
MHKLWSLSFSFLLPTLLLLSAGCNGIIVNEWAKDEDRQNNELFFLQKQSREGSELFKSSGQQSAPGNIKPNDLWGIHDMLLVGYNALFMKPHSEGFKEVQRAGLQLAQMLPRLHPVKACREQIKTSIEGADGKDQVRNAAAVSWSCLPANFSAKSFTSAFVGLDDVDTQEEAQKARMPHLVEESVLGACKNSKWPRTCSYWASMHLMSYRADQLGMGQQFLAAIFPLIAGGMTLCEGCTKHFRLLNEPALSNTLRDDKIEGF